MKYIKKIDIDFNEFDDVEENDYFRIDDSMKNKKYLKLFKKFLDENDALDKYIKNFLKNNNNNYNGKNVDNIAKVLNDLNVRYYISDDFFWGETEEGDGFWVKIYLKWDDYLNRFNI